MEFETKSTPTSISVIINFNFPKATNSTGGLFVFNRIWLTFAWLGRAITTTSHFATLKAMIQFLLFTIEQVDYRLPINEKWEMRNAKDK
jgi:hypothetical protein